MVESMKMELEVKATADGKIDYTVAQGAAIQAGQVIATIGGGAVAAPVAQPANAAPAAPASTGGAAVNAPVAGTLLKNCMAEGATVKAGDTIVMIESMKMELEVKATANGTVHYLASAGAAIQAGQPLAEIK
jgi:oxaloacetate decarboxylase alpha subunit